MKKHIPIFVLFSLAMPFISVYATPQDEQFQQIAHDYIEGYLQPIPKTPRSWVITGLTTN